MDNKKISNLSWGILIGISVLVDGTQVFLEWLLIGFVLNPIINIFMSMSLALYFYMNGQSLINPKRAVGMAGALIGEMVPIVAELPLWTAYVVYNMFLTKAEDLKKNILEKKPEGDVVENKT